jgi:hypothetical protein
MIKSRIEPIVLHDFKNGDHRIIPALLDRSDGVITAYPYFEEDNSDRAAKAAGQLLKANDGIVPDGTEYQII